MQNQIIIVTGTPGVGKTVLGKLLAKQTNSLYLDIGELVKTERLYSRFDRASKAFVIDERRLNRRLSKYFLLNDRKGIVVETHSLGRYMPKRSRMIALVLRLDPTILARRLRSRRWNRRKIWNNVEAEFIDQSLYEAWSFLGAGRIYEIDTSFKSPKALLRRSMKMISTRRESRSKPVDWLRKYDPLEVLRRIL